MTHTIRQIWGFEDQQTTRFYAVSGTAPPFDTTTASNSRRAVKWDGSAASVPGYLQFARGFTAAGAWDTTTQTHWWSSFHIYLTSLPVAGQNFYLGLSVFSGGTTASAVFVDSAGTVWIYNGTTATSESALGTLSAGVYYVVSHRISRNSTIEVVVRNRATTATVASKQHSGNIANTALIYYLLGPSAASRGICSFDNFVIECDDTLANIADPVLLMGTNFAVGLLGPTAAVGTYDAWTGTNADVDEYPQDGNTSFRSVPGTLVAFTAPLFHTSTLITQVGTIYATQHFAYCRESAGGTTCQLRIRSATTDSDSANFEPIFSATVYTPVQLLLILDPATASSWTASALDAAEVGIERVDATDTSFCTEVGLEVLYNPTTIRRVKRVHYLLDFKDPLQRIRDAETGRIIPYSEVRANRFMRILSISPPSPEETLSLYRDESVVFLERVAYSWTESGESLSIEGADDFVETLMGRLENTSSSV